MKKSERYVFLIHHLGGNGRENAALLTWILDLHHIATMYGENVAGKLSDEVQKRLESAGLVIAVLTRDVEVGEGRYQPSQWCLMELTWAIAHRVPCILVVEEGVEFDGGLAGDWEQIRFAPGDFASILQRVANQATSLLDTVVLPQDLPEENLSDQVWRLIVEAREQAAERNFEEFRRLSEKALTLDPTAWRAMLNIGVAQVKLGQLTFGKQIFRDVLKIFENNDQAKWLAHHNLGWLEQVKNAADPYNVDGLLKEQACYLEALAALHSSVHTRASLIQCRVLLGKVAEASSLLMQSLNYSGFPEALRYETVNRGHLGHHILRQLPEAEWLYPLLFPVWSNDNGELRKSGYLVNQFE